MGLVVGGSIGGTILYAKWDQKFRAALEKNVPYSDWLLGLALGPAPQDAGLPPKKQVSVVNTVFLLVCFFVFWFQYVFLAVGAAPFSD